MGGQFTSKLSVGLLVFVCIIGLGTPTAFCQQKEVTVMTYSGVWGDSFKTNIADPFTKKTGIKVNMVTMLTARDGMTKLMAQKENPQIDVWTADNATHALAAERGLLAALSEKTIPNLKFSKHKGTETSAVWYTFIPGIYYRSDKVPFALKTWEDLWDSRLKGKVAVPETVYSSARFMVVVSLLNGGSEKNMDPGFAKLAALKPNIGMFYRTDAESIKFLESGEATVCAMGLLPNVYKLLGKDSVYRFVVPQKPQLVILNNTALIKGRDPKLGSELIDYMLSIQAQEAHCSAIGLIPVNKNASVPEKLKSIIPPNFDNLYSIDFDVVNQGIGGWTERFNKDIKGI
jgi:putative spermidine/putrescine transport system substrate-binding protein